MKVLTLALALLFSSVSRADDKPAIINWANNYLPTNTCADDPQLAEKLIFAFRTMYIQASTYFAGPPDFYTQVIQNPTTPIWSLCGNSSDFIVKAFTAFGIPVRGVSMWSWYTDGHSAIEYWSNTFSKWVYYDPLYGMGLINIQGVPASVADIQGDIAKNGFNWWLWEYKEQRLLPGITAANSDFQYYNSVGYWVILWYHLNVMAVRYQDLSPWGGYLAGVSPPTHGKWLFYDNTVASRLTEDQKGVLVQELLQEYSVLRGGAYALTLYRLFKELP